MGSSIDNTHVPARFHPARHQVLVLGIAQLWNALDLAWHSHLRLDPRELKGLKGMAKDRGLVLIVNHADETDVKVCLEVARLSRCRFTYMVNSEAFEEWHGFAGWFLERMGGFSVERGGNDQTAMRYAVDVVRQGQGALVLFPEGEISYLNDLMQPFKAGAVHAGLQAIAETRVTYPAWTAYLVAVIIKYRYCRPIGAVLKKKISAIERRLQIHANLFTFQEKIIGIMSKLLKLPRPESADAMTGAHLAQLKEEVRQAQTALLTKIETKYPQFEAIPAAELVKRARKIMSFLRDRLVQKKLFTPGTRQQLQQDIKDIRTTIQMASWQPQYIDLTPSEERLAETVMKLERQVFMIKRPPALGRRDIFVRFITPLDLGCYAEAYRKDPHAVSLQVSEELRGRMQAMINTM